MTPTSPTWGDVEKFLEMDGWRQLSAGERGGRRQRHIDFEKVLDDRRVLKTHISHHRGKTISPGRFSSILRYQLEVSRREFWHALEAGAPVDRPVATDDDDVVELPAWTLPVLTGELHMSAEKISRLTADEAERLVHEHWSRPK